MRRASRSARQPRRALAGVALAALLAWAPFGMAAQTSAYADDSEAQEAPAVEEVITFDEVSPDEGSFDADESAGANNEDDQLASNDVTLITDDTALATGANEHLVSNDEALVTGDGIVAYSSDALPASEDDALLPDVSTTDALISIGDAAACLDEGESEDTDIVALASSSATYDGILAIRANKSYTLAYQVLTLVNQERAKQGLSSLTMDADLLSAAMQRGAEIAVYFSHTRPTGESYYTACSKMRGENIASGYRTAEAVMQAWMNSTGHRANILSANSKSIGISCVQVGNRYYWVQCFGTTAATTTSKPADVSNALMKVSYAKDELAEVTLSIVPVTSDGTRIDGDGSLLVGSSQRYALYMGSTPIDNSCVTWSLSSTVAKLNTSTAAVTATGVGSFTITASVGGGTVKQTRTCTTAMPVYTVSFYSNGGSNVTSQSVTSGQKATKPADPTKTGYNFTGWYSDKALTKAYSFNAAVTSNMTLYAGWERITYTVSFNSNGGSAVANQTVTWGARATKPANPTKAGYTFTGWYSDSALTQAYNFSNTLVKSNVTLYAGWKQVTYTVSFNSNGASNVASQTVTWGAAATKPADPAKSEFAFTGWYSDKALTKAYDFKTPVKSNMTLYAGWKQVIFTVSFNSQGGSAVANQKVALGSAATRPADPTKKGFTFTGWYTDTSFKTLYDFGKTVSFNTLLQAGWKQNICTVTFETNGGSSVASQTVVGGGKATKPATPTKAGYMFVGWYCNRALTVAYDFGTTVQSDLTLYASWKQVACTVSFVTNGGSAVAAQTVAWGGKAARPADPTKAGYIFTGWYADKALSSSYDFQTAVKSSRILYAGWRADPSALSYKDVPAGEWYTYWVAEATDAGLMTGMKDAAGNYTGYFEPNRAITRAEVATVLWRIAGSPSAGSSSMSDMRGHWAEAAVAWCSAKDIVTGYTNGPDAGRFLPDNQVSRQELACMVWRFAKWAGVDTANPSTTAFNYCADAQLVPDWSRDAMIWCASASIITGIQGNGRPTLSPEVGATRAMAAKIFVRTQSRCARAAGSHSDDTAVDEAVQEALDQVTFEDVQTPQVTHGQTDEGLAYALVPEGATDKQGNAYVPGQAYAELGGRYVGAGAYVTGYTGESTELVLPAQIEGADVVSASLSWKGDAEAGQPDPDGRTRLEGLTLQRGCMLASLDASGSLLAGLALAGDESLGGLEHLHFLDLSSTQVASLDTAALPALEELALRDCPLTADALAKLASWRSATNLAADLTDAGEKAEQAGGAVGATDGPADSSADQAVAPDGTTEGDTTFDAVETGEPNQSGNAAETPSDDLNQAGDAGDVAAPVEPTDADEPDIAGEPGTSADAEGSADSPEPTPLDAPDALAA